MRGRQRREHGLGKGQVLRRAGVNLVVVERLGQVVGQFGRLARRRGLGGLLVTVEEIRAGLVHLGGGEPVIQRAAQFLLGDIQRALPLRGLAFRLDVGNLKGI